MVKNDYYAEDKCTMKIARELMCASTATISRYMSRVRKELQIKPYGFVSVGDLCKHLYRDGRLDWNKINLLHRV